ncbi:glycosyltransferase [Flavobacterium sp. S87F.05.LMB.W.Kidney.N]|uniref:glycosyltransferase n=1 Tax=Flavobacterium sp. S87F.05.LMB.W.Kidney.N TaxID=1278758 RepID=UPI0010658DDC|nr:glycosyltransferase [Flavobacterium sp. S87F.05.LMB.W.Kidney.N]TDX09278.1 glycosyl transferase family 1 [Flavobacterium sp. S87F.05.LMB.W.Kidney.N]
MHKFSENKIVLITGSYNPDICGVGDYTEKLFKNLQKSNLSNIIDLLVWRDWTFFKFWSQLKKIKKNYTTVHLQYPTEGYGYSLYPILLFFLLKSKKRIVTLHEYSQRTRKARLATSLFFYCSDHIIFTTEQERNFVINKFKFVKDKSEVINIASNIASPEEKINWEDRKFDIAYFGHIRPHKGIEDFIEIARISKNKSLPVKFIVVGQVQERFKEYSNTLFLNKNDNDIECFFNNTDIAVSDLLQNSKILYLPFPDGISMRRGSFLAGIENNCLVVSNKGDFDSGLSKYALLFDIENDYNYRLDAIQNLFFEEKERKKILENIQNFQGQITWDQIISKHVKLYEL